VRFLTSSQAQDRGKITKTLTTVSSKIACCVKQLFRLSFRRKEHNGKRDTQQGADGGPDHWSPDKC
jgi:hypothetical protein